MYGPTDLLSVESWILLITILVLARYYLHRKWQVLLNMNIPHDKPSVLKLGNLTSFLSGDKFMMDNENKKKYGSIWGSYIFTTPSITIHDIDILRQVFIKEFPSFPIRQDAFLKLNGKEMNTSLIATRGDQWKRTRSSMTPTFSTSKLKEMTSIIEWCASNTIEALNRKNRDGDGTFNAKDLFSKLSLDIVCSAAFSTKVHSQDDTKEEPEIAVQAKKFFNISFVNPVFLICLVFPFMERVFEKLDLPSWGNTPQKYFKKLTNYVIAQRESNPHGLNRVDLMQLMLDAEISEEEASKGAQKGMTRNEIIGNSILMIIAGYENTANTMGYLAYNLAQHPKIQEDLQKEIEEMIENHGKFDYEGVNSLKLLDMCFNESLRLYNPILRNARICTKDITINGLTIPKGVTIGVPVYALSHDPDYWEEPFEFRPERMRDMSQIDPMVFQPFGAGPRNCIGMRFAIMEVKMSIAKVLQKFSFVPAENTPKPPLKLKFGVSVRPAEDYCLRAVPRVV